MIRIGFDAPALLAKLAEARGALDDMTPINEDIGEYVLEQTRDRFRSSTAPDGTRWRDKRPATIARYLARGDGNKPKPLIGPSGRLSKEIVRVAGRDQVEIGSALEYSGVMQDGARKGAFGKNKAGRPLPWGDIPSRVWLGLSDGDDTLIVRIVDGYLRRALDYE